jgi:membrane protein
MMVLTKNAGREATGTTHAPPAGWKGILLGVRDEVRRDNVSLVAAGVAFYVFLAVFPAIAALVSLYGLLYDPADIQRQTLNLTGLIPPQAVELLQDQLSRVAGAERTLGMGFALGIALTMWGASRGMKALMNALGTIYGVTERRNFIRFNVVGFFFALCAMAFILVALGVITVFPIALRALGLPELSPLGTELLRWVPLGIFVMIGLALLYRYAPHRKEARFRWVSWGSLAAALLWLLASAVFSQYVSYFGNFNATYGSLGAAIILLLWFYLGVYAVLLGAGLNSEIERRSRA